MYLLRWSLILILIIIASKEVNGESRRKQSHPQRTPGRICVLDGKECAEDQNEPWSYTGANGPSNWGGCCANGTRQSPISIGPHWVIRNDSLKPIVYINYNIPIGSATMVNNGHTVQVTPTDSTERKIEGSGLQDSFVLKRFHFHWGVNNTFGSEHVINGGRYPMEMHLVHTTSTGGVAVIGAMFNTVAPNNTHLDPIVKALRSIRCANETVNLGSGLNLASILPQDATCNFYRYQGSLTTVPCTENVTWTILKTPILIGFCQMEEFRNLYKVENCKDAGPECHLVGNYRPTQKLNNRPVYSSVCWK